MENDEKIEDIDLEEPESILDNEGNDTFDWKSDSLKRHGMLKRFKTKSEKLAKDFEEYKKTHPDVKEEQKPQDKKEFDLAEKSYILANGIKKEYIPLVWDEFKASGKTIDEVLGSKYFQEKLEMEITKNATPSGTKRTGGAAKDDVGYWLQKGEFPPDTPENTELRRKVAKALSKKHSEGNKFSPRPIV